MRFCGSCGAALAGAPAQEVRKVITALFADITGSTALGERLDPESLRLLMARYFDEMKAIVEYHGGVVEKFIGDAIMAVFGIPTMHEDDARRAVRAAAGMRERLDNLNTELESDFGVRLEARIGMNTGEVVASQNSSGERLATGDAVNVAARLEQTAGPGDILIGEQTLKLARDIVEVEPVDPLTLKGKTEPVTAYRVLRVVEGAPDFGRRFDAPLVGRREELARVRDAFDHALRERRCGLVTVLGPPGIGKSRLARELAADVAGEATVFFGRCLPYGEGITYWPVREIFTAAGAEPEFEAALALGAPEEIFWAVRKALEERARQKPIVLVLEDIHWAEPTLLDLIEHLTDWSRDAQLVVLCLARPELLDERPAWGVGRPNADTLSLQPLGIHETDELIQNLLGGTRLDDEARARITQVAEGNPLFVEQLLAMLAEGGKPDHVPSTIHSLLAARLDALPEQERDLLERASIVGLEFEWQGLAELSPDRQRPPGTQLTALVRKELIQPHETIADTFRFRHILVRDAAYERVPKERRSDLHERFARWIDDRDEEFEEIVDYHLEQAYRCISELGTQSDRARALAEEAATRLASSGRRAEARGDTTAAANLLGRATTLLPADDVRRLHLLPALGRALREAGEVERADSVLSEALARGRASGTREVAADAAVALSLVQLHTGRLNRAGQDVVARVLKDAMPVFEELGDKAALARALGAAATLRFWRGEAAAAAEDLARAARHARDAGDWAQEAESLRYMLVAILLGPTSVDEALDRIEEIRPRIQANRKLRVAFLHASALLEAKKGRLDVARGLIAQAKALAEERGLKLLLASQVAQGIGYIELLAGDAVAAERALRPAAEALEQMGELGYLSSIGHRLCAALYLQERYDEALQLLDRWEPDRLTVPEDVDAHVGWRSVRANLLARRGDLEEAERLAREAAAMASRTDYLEWHAESVEGLAEVLRLAGRSEEAEDAVQKALRLHERKGNIAAVTRLTSQWDAVPPPV